ncbi:hypothetical protein [Paenibacillus radicis (ex Gao et al. 2016)]|uniref:Uncharacterized protein n=1 Tax=Paenibacillus radicis (ex Gao et al. 2016) TaxID=1737354 RepID=A0A917HMA0_9BACL|nr:hypothetical protein [Paenibacillus radicis (ex Gao et al. 2016)]GGG84151.1 hypothetical protein GCM10010918_47410 [Paenibacillus radicis (ex Gao et al. 2016)]
MSCRPCDPFCPTVRVYDPPVTVYNDVFHPQIVEVVHRVNVVNRHHCVPCEKHLYEYCYHNEEVSNEGEHNNHHRSRSNRSRSRYAGVSKVKAAAKNKNKKKK